MIEKKENWVVKLTYMDEKSAHVILPKEEIPKFLEAFKAKKEYWSPNEDAAFLTDVDKVRFVNIGKEAQEENTELKTDEKSE